MYERFHWFGFVFFLESAIYALFSGLSLFAIWITATNAIYNITSILLQQYNRIRIDRLMKGNKNLKRITIIDQNHEKNHCSY